MFAFVCCLLSFLIPCCVALQLARQDFSSLTAPQVPLGTAKADAEGRSTGAGELPAPGGSARGHAPTLSDGAGAAPRFKLGAISDVQGLNDALLLKYGRDSAPARRDLPPLAAQPQNPQAQAAPAAAGPTLAPAIGRHIRSRSVSSTPGETFFDIGLLATASLVDPPASGPAEGSLAEGQPHHQRHQSMVVPGTSSQLAPGAPPPRPPLHRKNLSTSSSAGGLLAPTGIWAMTDSERRRRVSSNGSCWDGSDENSEAGFLPEADNQQPDQSSEGCGPCELAAPDEALAVSPVSSCDSGDSAWAFGAAHQGSVEASDDGFPVDAAEAATDGELVVAGAPRNRHFCSLCGICATSEAHLEAHYSGKRHQKNLVNMYRGAPPPSESAHFHCPLCNVSATSEAHLGAHFRGKQHIRKLAAVTGTSSGVPIFHCSLCNVTATSAGHLMAHFRGKQHRRKARISEYEDAAAAAEDGALEDGDGDSEDEEERDIGGGDAAADARSKSAAPGRPRVAVVAPPAPPPPPASERLSSHRHKLPQYPHHPGAYEYHHHQHPQHPVVWHHPASPSAAHPYGPPHHPGHRMGLHPHEMQGAAMMPAGAPVHVQAVMPAEGWQMHHHPAYHPHHAHHHLVHQGPPPPQLHPVGWWHVDADGRQHWVPPAPMMPWALHSG